MAVAAQSWRRLHPTAAQTAVAPGTALGMLWAQHGWKDEVPAGKQKAEGKRLKQAEEHGPRLCGLTAAPQPCAWDQWFERREARQLPRQTSP